MIPVVIFPIIIVLFCIIHRVTFLSEGHNAVSTREIWGREHLLLSANTCVSDTFVWGHVHFLINTLALHPRCLLSGSKVCNEHYP